MEKKFYAPVDGLRALCFCAVLLFHCKVPGFELGWAGVQVFFVISGFLIGGILIDTKDKNSFFKNFYIRRILRIFPVYYAAVVVCAFYIITGGGGGYT
jgi:peptidoglycan/LPS O-acetylase OafA/YrhL